ncbi:hypothetical protein CKK34_6321 [Yarrowia sp. E02]|nr:hypothetical protein CKK34_6321 [Yarrowia sp. E02]
MLKDIRLPRIQPSATGGALAWSADGDLCIAAGSDAVVLNVNGPITSRDDEIDSVRDRNWAQFPETNFTINKSDTMDTVAVTAGGSTSIPGNQIQYGSGDRHVADLAWSPTGLGKMHGCLVGLLNTTHELFIYDHRGQVEKHPWKLCHNVAELLYKRVKKESSETNGDTKMEENTNGDTTMVDNDEDTPKWSRAGTPSVPGIPEQEYTPEQYYSFQIHSFAWSPTLNNQNYVAVGTGRGEIIVLSVAVNDIKIVASTFAGDRQIVKLAWDVTPDGGSALVAVSDANEVMKLTWDNEKQELSQPTTLINASRFVIAAMSFVKGTVAVSQPHRLTWVSPEGTIESPPWGDSNTVSDIAINDGKVLVVTYKGGVVYWNPASNTMEEQEQTMALLMKRLTTAKENNGSLNGVTPSFNTLDYEAVISGATISPHGTFLSIFYAVTPTNVLKFPIPSTVVTRVAFVPLITPTSLSYDAVPLRPSSMAAGEAMQSSQWEFQVWGRVAQKLFKHEDSQAGMVFKSNYLEHLATQFNLSPSQHITQHMAETNGSLEDLLNSVFLSDELDKARFSAFYDLTLIPEMQKLLFSLVLYYVSKNWETVSPKLSGYDFAILSAFTAIVGQQEPPIPLTPESGLVTVETDFISESFDMTAQAQNLEVVVSTEGHTWKRCALTQLPILILDPLTPSWGPSKILNWRSLEPSTLGYLTKTLLTVFPLCPYTGTRYYENVPQVYNE